MHFKYVSIDEYLTIGHVRYINILARLRGFRVKIANFQVSFVSQFPEETWIQRKQHQI